MPDFERRTFAEGREALAADRGTALGEPFDVSAPAEEPVAMMLRRPA